MLELGPALGLQIMHTDLWRIEGDRPVPQTPLQPEALKELRLALSNAASARVATLDWCGSVRKTVKAWKTEAQRTW